MRKTRMWRLASAVSPVYETVELRGKAVMLGYTVGGILGNGAVVALACVAPLGHHL